MLASGHLGWRRSSPARHERSLPFPLGGASASSGLVPSEVPSPLVAFLMRFVEVQM